MSYEYYTLPQNTSGAVNIPIFNTPTPLASITLAAGSGNDLATLRANIGWRSLSDTLVPVQVLFKIWRGAPVSGDLICSVQDSAEALHDEFAITDFSDVVAGLVSNQPITFVLTAETIAADTLAEVIGPLTFAAYGTNLSALRYFEFPNNIVGGANIPVAQTPVPVAVFEVAVQPSQVVVLRPAVGWKATGDLYPKVDVLFKLWRGAPVTGVLVASADDSADREEMAVTSFSHVDSGFTTAQTIAYVLTAEAPDPDHRASIVGAMTLTGAFPSVGAFYTLPQNTAGSVNIPIISTGAPLAALTVETPELNVFLRASIGWATPSPPIETATPVLFKIWRGAPDTGTLVYSALDSGEGNWDNRKVTALNHVDSGFTASGPVTYTLTVELINPGIAANVVGPLTFTVDPES
ncbi:hypothetical protein [Desulfosporosinus youngiae]|uniref:Uncharacterized protein n=1 Tax=Desulfosporosinus youngiae DSM 17734 TaxID=768710 RepID=H5Y2U1_9FIRM|nr:hypothetical protein [Desulfosporosinus youngiae]EHQ88498.1 hypothetical protein DesyoDRAFT_1339 [Desulfosporosinus youngiae DSM 17734]